MQLLYERPDLPAYALPRALAERFTGTLGFPKPVTYANFVASLDGVAAIRGVKNSPSVISGHSDVDRFVMGLLRACAEAIVIGAGTLRATPRALWTPEAIYPGAATGYADLRANLGLSPAPQFIVLSARGDLDASAPALEVGALVLTTKDGAARLANRLPRATTIKVLGGGTRLDVSQVQEELERRAFNVVLAEGGPNLMGQLVQARLLDELFLTTSPKLAGADPLDTRQDRPGFVHGTRLLPDLEVAGDLMAVRRDGSHLFLRYGFSAHRSHSSDEDSSPHSVDLPAS